MTYRLHQAILSSGGSGTPVSPGDLDQEDGFTILLESGDALILEE